MAERTVREVVIKTTTVGTTQAGRELDATTAKVRNLKRESAMGGGAGGYGTFGQQAKAFGLTGENSVVSLLRGGGGMMIIGLFTTALEGLAKEIQEHTKRIKQGWTQTESVLSMLQHIPVAGGFGAGLRALWDELGIPSAPDVHRWLKEGVRLPRTREEAEKFDVRRTQAAASSKEWAAMEEKRRTFMEQSQDAAISAMNEVRLLGKSGTLLERTQRDINYEKRIRELDKEMTDLRRQKRFLTETEQADFEKNQAIQREAARRIRDAPVSEPFMLNRIGIPSTTMLTGAGGQDFRRQIEIEKQAAADTKKSREALEKIVSQGVKVNAAPLLK